MAPQNSTLINLINDDIKSITSERLSPIPQANFPSTSDDYDDDEQDEDYDVEIIIYIGRAPRFVSGVNKKTTCNDVIKALIDDELANTKISKHTVCDVENYTIYEKWQDVEHALEGDEMIYDLWQNWGEKGRKGEVQFRLKINRHKECVDERIKSKKSKNDGIKKLLKKVIQQGEIIQKHLTKINDIDHNNDYILPKAGRQIRMDNYAHESSIFSCPKWENESKRTTDEEDELFLVIENHNDNDSGVFISKAQQLNTFENQLLPLPETPKRKYRRSKDYDQVKGHLINQAHKVEFHQQHDQFTRASFKFDMVRDQIREKMDGMKEIIQQEQSFLKRIQLTPTDDFNDLTDCDEHNEFFDSINKFCDNNDSVHV